MNTSKKIIVGLSTIVLGLVVAYFVLRTLPVSNFIRQIGQPPQTPQEQQVRGISAEDAARELATLDNYPCSGFIGQSRIECARAVALADENQNFCDILIDAELIIDCRAYYRAQGGPLPEDRIDCSSSEHRYTVNCMSFEDFLTADLPAQPSTLKECFDADYMWGGCVNRFIMHGTEDVDACDRLDDRLKQGECRRYIEFFESIE